MRFNVDFVLDNNMNVFPFFSRIDTKLAVNQLSYFRKTIYFAPERNEIFSARTDSIIWLDYT